MVFVLNQSNPTGKGLITLEIHGRFGSSKFGCQPISNFRFTKLITIFQFGKEQGFAIWEVRVADFEKNVTPHYFWYNLVKFCTIVKCYTISES